MEKETHIKKNNNLKKYKKKEIVLTMFPVIGLFTKSMVLGLQVIYRFVDLHDILFLKNMF